MTNKVSNLLIDAVDDAATKLLSEVLGDAILGEEGRDALVERVKVFQAVVEWVKVRHHVDPPESDKGAASERFSKFKQQFNGDAPRRGRGRPPAAGGAPSPAGESGAAADVTPALDS